MSERAPQYLSLGLYSVVHRHIEYCYCVLSLQVCTDTDKVKYNIVILQQLHLLYMMKEPPIDEQRKGACRNTVTSGQSCMLLPS